jgi:hypothetical protein
MWAWWHLGDESSSTRLDFTLTRIRASRQPTSPQRQQGISDEIAVDTESVSGAAGWFDQQVSLRNPCFT